MAQSLDYSKVAFDLIDDLDGLTNVGKVTRVAATLAEFGYTSFLITGVPEPPQKLEPYILLNGWPRGWTEHYTRSNYYADDPVAAWCRRTVNPFEWSQAPFNAERSPRAAEVMNVAREFGLDHGFLVPIVAGTGFQACVTMAGERPNCEASASSDRHVCASTLCRAGRLRIRRSAPADFERTGARRARLVGGRQIKLGNRDHSGSQRTHNQLAR
jgi:LuxR family transcriptional regulator, quorum-sensing system regulator BjaR1